MKFKNFLKIYTKLIVLLSIVSLNLFVFNNCALQSNMNKPGTGSDSATSTNPESSNNSENSTPSPSGSTNIKCQLNGVNFEVGQSLIGYTQSSQTYPQLCGEPVQRTCLPTGQFNASVPLYSNCQQQCKNPITQAAMSSGEIYSFYSKNQASSSEECEAARIESICQQDSGTLLPNPSNFTNKYTNCAVVTNPVDPVDPPVVLNCTYPSGSTYATPNNTLVNGTVTGFSAQSAIYPQTCTGLNTSVTCKAVSASMADWSGAIPLYKSCTQKCLNPDNNSALDIGMTLTYSTIASGTEAECNAAKKVYTCTSNGTFSAAIPSTKFNSCAVVTPPPPVDPPPVVTTDILGLGACVAGKGKDYQVGPGAGQLASLDLVPWESLAAGDTVRIFYSSTAYKGKFILSGQGTASAPIRVCGVKNAAGLRPIIDGNGAKSRSTAGMGSSGAQQKGLVFIKTGSNKTAVPSYVQIDGLVLKSAHSSYSFTDQSGASLKYADFSACIWFENGNNVTIADNEITDCGQGIFSISVDGSESTLTRNLRIAGNIFTNNGMANDPLKHVNYIQTMGVTYEYNIYKALRSGATGNSIKDRSVGVIIRYNRIEAGTRNIDLVDAEEHKLTAKADPKYRETFVYGNQFIKNSRELIHYGGDHPGEEQYFRKGTLYFFNNSIKATGNVKIFQITSTDEKVEAFNNVIYYDSGTPTWRSDDETASGNLPTGGKLNLGKNWINTGWRDSDTTLSSAITGTNNILTGSGAPFDTNFTPVAGSALINAGGASVTGAQAHPVTYQLSTLLQPEKRPTTTAADIGAVERP